MVTCLCKIQNKYMLQHDIIKHINEEILKGDYSSFDRLTEPQQAELVESWTDEMKLKYLTRNPAMTEEEFFAELDKIADGTFNRERSL